MEPHKYDYSELQGDIRKTFGTQGAFAKAMGMVDATMSLKLNNKAEWSQDEMFHAVDLLGKDASMIKIYFFTHTV